jgi:hypothetical protein
MRAKKRTNKWQRSDRIQALILLALVLTAVVYMATCWVNKLALRQAEVAARPLLEAINPSLAPLVVGQTPAVTLALLNSGPMPAIDVQAGTRLQIGDMPLFTDNAYQPSDERPVTIGSQQRITITVTGDHSLTPGELAGLNDGTQELKVHGEIVYCAPSGSEPLPHVHFCFVYEPTSRQMIVCDAFGTYEDRGRFRNSMNCHPRQ